MSVKDPRKLQEAVDRKVLQDEGVAVPDDSFSAYDSETNPVNEQTYPEMLVGANPDAGEGPRSRRQRHRPSGPPKVAARQNRQEPSAWMTPGSAS